MNLEKENEIIKGCGYCKQNIMSVKMLFETDSIMGEEKWFSSTRSPVYCPMCGRKVGRGMTEVERALLKRDERKILEHYGEEKQIIHTLEELGELSVELAKYLQIKDKEVMGTMECMCRVVEEMGDVRVMLDQLEMAFRCGEDMKESMRGKVDRELGRMGRVSNFSNIMEEEFSFDNFMEETEMILQSESKPILEYKKSKVIRGRENVPEGDNFAHWSCHYEYKNKKTNETLKLEGLQEKYCLGFAQKELWDIIERDYVCEEVYTMNVNHPRYKVI